MFRNIIMLCAILCGLTLLSAIASEGKETSPAPVLVDNPAYQSWAKFGPGTYVRFTTTYLPKPTTEGFAVESSTTCTLKTVTEDKVKIAESTIVTLASGKSVARTPRGFECPAKIRKPAEAPKPVEEGEETIKVGDEQIATTWTKTVTVNAGTTVTTTIWTSDSIPGGTVKSVIEQKSEKATTTETKILVAYEVVELEGAEDEATDETGTIDATGTVDPTATVGEIETINE